MPFIFFYSPRLWLTSLGALEIIELFLLISIINCITTWCLTTVKYYSRRWQKCYPTLPPTFPYIIPLWGNTFDFLLRPRSFMLRAGKFLGSQIPVKVRLIAGDVFVVRGGENLASLWRESVHSNYAELLGFMLNRMFNMPKSALRLYENDDSGFSSKPHPDSKVLPHNRVDYITHQLAKEYLLSPGSVEIVERFGVQMKKQLDELDVTVGHEWTQMSDLREFFEEQMTPANFEATYGPTLLSHHPGFCRDFWAYNRHLSKLCKLPPWLIRWAAPEAYHARNRMLSAIEHWQALMRQMSESPDAAKSELADAYWGPEPVRRWQDKLLAMDGFDEKAVAALYLGMIWVSNFNLIPSAFWMALEVFRDPNLLRRFRASVSSGTNSPLDGSHSDLPSASVLAKMPLPQSVFAETLRLRVQAYITRFFSHKSIVLDSKWVIPQKKICLVSTHPAHVDEAVWNTKAGQHPLDSFWSDRFLAYPNDPRSGPSKPAEKGDPELGRVRKPQRSATAMGSQGGPAFTVEGVASSFIPFGGGPRICPGRHLAKQQVLTVVSQLVMRYDIEILARETAWDMDERSYGPGVQHPVGKIPFRIRRRNRA